MCRAFGGRAIHFGFDRRSNLVPPVAVHVRPGLDPRVWALGLLGRMQREQRVFMFAAEGLAARPREAGSAIGHAGPDRVEVDVAHAAQQVCGIVDQAGAVATFPQGAGALVVAVELADVLAAELLHQGQQPGQRPATGTATVCIWTSGGRQCTEKPRPVRLQWRRRRFAHRQSSRPPGHDNVWSAQARPARRAKPVPLSQH